MKNNKKKEEKQALLMQEIEDIDLEERINALEEAHLRNLKEKKEN
jgi:hypothetical protein